MFLPPRTDLPTEPIVRRHNPTPGTYKTFRPCLRWEFGFSCAFCFLHEADFFSVGNVGTEGTGLFTAEHRSLQSRDEARIDDYANCYYACRFCNGARSNRPITDADGRTLLDPCAVAWGSRFSYEQDELRSRRGDRDAQYTCEAYDLDDPRKTTLRHARRMTVAASLEVLANAPKQLDDLLRLSETVRDHERMDLLDVAEELQNHVNAARADLSRFSMIPTDHDAACRCGADGVRGLPAFLAAQAIGVEGTPVSLDETLGGYR